MRLVRTNVVFWTCLLSLGFGGAFSTSTKAQGKPSSESATCKKYLNLNGVALETALPSMEKFKPFLAMLHAVLTPTLLHWAPRTFRPNAPVDLRRFTELAAELRNPGSHLNLELNEYSQIHGGFQSAKLWDEYLVAYDKIAAFSSGMLTVAAAMDEIMPKTGRIAEFGSGSGNISSFLALNEPNRQIIALDFAKKSLALSAKKLASVTGNNKSRYETIHFDLRGETLPDEIPTKSLDGAVMNNVLYTLGDHKLATLQKMRNAMKDGAPVVISDVINLSQMDFQTFLVETAISSLQNGSPAQEVDIVLSARVNLQLLISGDRPEQHRLLSIEEHKALYEKAGFVVHGIFRSYHNAAALFYMTAGQPKGT